MKKTKTTLLLLSLLLCSSTGCGRQTEPEDLQKNINECFSNTDLTNCAKIDFISYKTDNDAPKKAVYSCLCKREDINYIYRHQDFYEAVYRTFTNISSAADDYELNDIEIAGDDIISNGQSHYVQIRLKEPIDVSLTEQKFDEISFLLFDAENGDFWLGNEDDTYVVYGNLPRQEEMFKVNNELIDYIEGNFPLPQYSSYLEEIINLF